jgi:aromatic-L-amino-acid decarboxylase
VVCFRAKPAGREWTEGELTRLNEAILKRVNDTGEIFISHTVLGGRYTLRIAIGNLQTTERHVRRAWELVQQALADETR